MFNKYDAMDYIRENDVEFIRLQFCDIFGNLKNISIMSWELEKAFEYGVSFDASSVKGFLNVSESDLYLFPDPSTLSVLPWRPQSGKVVRFYCDIRRADGSIFEGDCRNILIRTAEKAEKLDYEFNVGSKFEFYLFKTEENGVPSLAAHDDAGYCDVAPLDKGENVRRSICLTLKEMGILVENSYHEVQKGQHEIALMYDSCLRSADNFTTMKSVVKTVAHQNGLYASFMPKPIDSASGNGAHLNMRLCKNGKNLFEKGEISEEGGHFAAGILNNINAICLFANPLVNSYKRLLTGFKAPKYVSWSHMNNSQLIRIPKALGEGGRIELRSPDSAINPYITYSLLLEAGLRGIEEKAELMPETADFSANLKALPSNLAEAIEAAQGSKLIYDVLGETTIEKYIEFKKEEWESYRSAVSDWELKRYF